LRNARLDLNGGMVRYRTSTRRHIHDMTRLSTRLVEPARRRKEGRPLGAQMVARLTITRLRNQDLHRS
jgi:hypothetical protein